MRRRSSRVVSFLVAAVVALPFVCATPAVAVGAMDSAEVFAVDGTESGSAPKPMLGAAPSLVPSPAGFTATIGGEIGGTLVPITPTRVMDTRIGLGGGSLGGGSLGGGTRVLDLSAAVGTTEYPVIAVSLNVTLTGASTATHLTLWGNAASSPPAISNLNIGPGEIIANAATVETGGDAVIALRNNSGTVDVIVDLNGWYMSADAAAGGAYVPVTPERVMDTRIGQGGPALVGGTNRDLQPYSYRGTGAIPEPSAVVLNVTVVNPTTEGFLTVWPNGRPQPNTSNLNFRAGDVVANAVTVAVGDAQRVQLAMPPGTNGDVIVDILGYVRPLPVSTGGIHAVVPRRRADTRITAPVTPAMPLPFSVAGGGVPASGVAAVIVNLTATNVSADTHLTMWPSGSPQPDASSLNVRAGVTRANQVTVPVGTDGEVQVATNSGSTDVIVDIVGWVPKPYGASGSFDAVIDTPPGPIDASATGVFTIKGTIDPYGDDTSGGGVADVSLFVDGLLAGRPRVDPSTFPLSWSAEISAPSGGSHLISALVVGRSGSPDWSEITVDLTIPPPDTNLAGPHTKMIAASSGLDPAGPTVLQFSFSTEAPLSLAPNDVVVLPPTALAPRGLLRRVVGVRRVAGGSSISTAPAELEDVFGRFSVDVTRALGDSPSGVSLPASGTYALPGPAPTTFDAAGSVAIAGSFSVVRRAQRPSTFITPVPKAEPFDAAVSAQMAVAGDITVTPAAPALVPVAARQTVGSIAAADPLTISGGGVTVEADVSLEASVSVEVSGAIMGPVVARTVGNAAVSVDVQVPASPVTATSTVPVADLNLGAPDGLAYGSVVSTVKVTAAIRAADAGGDFGGIATATTLANSATTVDSLHYPIGNQGWGRASSGNLSVFGAGGRSPNPLVGLPFGGFTPLAVLPGALGTLGPPTRARIPIGLELPFAMESDGPSIVPGGSKVYSFSATAGDVVNVEPGRWVSDPAPGFRRGGVRIARADTNEIVLADPSHNPGSQTLLPVTGTYLVAATGGFVDGSSVLTVARAAVDPLPIVLNDPAGRTGTVPVSGQAQAFRFVMNQPGDVTVSMGLNQPGSGLTTYVLRDSSGILVETATGHYQLVPGDYTLHVFFPQPSEVPGEFRVWISTPQITAPLVVDDPDGLVVGVDIPRRTYRIPVTLAAGVPVWFWSDEFTINNAHLERAGEAVACGFNCPFTPLVAGEYELVGVASYELGPTAFAVSSVKMRPLVIDGPAQAFPFTVSGEEVLFPFEVSTANTGVSISVTGGDQSPYKVGLLAPDGSSLGSAVGNGDHATVLESVGTYTVVAGRFPAGTVITIEVRSAAVIPASLNSPAGTPMVEPMPGRVVMLRLDTAQIPASATWNGDTLVAFALVGPGAANAEISVVGGELERDPVLTRWELRLTSGHTRFIAVAIRPISGALGSVQGFFSTEVEVGTTTQNGQPTRLAFSIPGQVVRVSLLGPSDRLGVRLGELVGVAGLHVAPSGGPCLRRYFGDPIGAESGVDFLGLNGGVCFLPDTLDTGSALVRFV